MLGQLLVILVQFMDLILVLRWNLYMGLPDIVQLGQQRHHLEDVNTAIMKDPSQRSVDVAVRFFIGDETFDTAVERTFYVPLVVLAYKVCPAHLEATIFATLMGTSNIGRLKYLDIFSSARLPCFKQFKDVWAVSAHEHPFPFESSVIQ